MSNLKLKMTNPLAKHFSQVQDLCKRVYPFSKPWSMAQLESHRSYFPDGQLVVIDEEHGKVVGIAFSLIIDWNDYSPQDNWQDFTAGGFFHNHNPKSGKTLYGAEVMVDPEYRGQGIGKMLYKGRQQIVQKYGLKRIRAGARLRGYCKFKDKLSPQEYVKQVVDKKIYDPTLSFQLSNGFKAIGVAANYLFNDPESLGFAAVIEWLNPEKNTEKDFEKQNRSIESFLNEERFIPEFLPRELRQLVRKTTTILGKIIYELEGEKFYKKVESFREQLKKTRTKSKIPEVVSKLNASLQKERNSELFKLAHAFSLQLELVNVCEAAYRTWRQRQRTSPLALKTKLSLVYVLTAHPTEARSTKVVEIIEALLPLLIEEINNNFYINENALATQLRKLWLQPLSKVTKPSVLDEAEYIYSVIFASDIFDYILQEKPGFDLKLRTWVGGDKDGHPGVDKVVMRTCLNKSREKFLCLIEKKLQIILTDLDSLTEAHPSYRQEVLVLKGFSTKLKNLKVIANGDGTKVKTWSLTFLSFVKKASPFVRTHEQVGLLKRAIDFFPGFVLPIEFREDASLIKDALTNQKSQIREMIRELSLISGALDITYYAKGLIISHCESSEDIDNACRLVDLTAQAPQMPVIPLFESQEALFSAKKILKKWLKDKKNQDRVIRHWLRQFEVMLGYSDSSKQVGVIKSRLLISKTMDEIDKTMKAMNIKPIYFHGSGGSVARGGGSLKEQISWWSQAAIEKPKMTVQGEMIQRLFATKEILNSQCAHLTVEALRRKVRKVKRESLPALETFASYASEEYQDLINDQEKLNQLLEATPYRYLDVLKIGSRPSKRPSNLISISGLRAIPWVLCWTQTRSLLPTWWGLGRAWKKLTPQEKQDLKELYLRDAFFSSFIKTLGFSLAKVELDIWQLYFEKSTSVKLIKELREEYKAVIKFVN
ncbi:MAG: phosphoenolpyruvate carboxylase, partial [Bdellovibrionales bacterium]|nr:phosphoenolpyruvate carboxylase [Bdellovibrionales bacterium]